MTERIIIFIVVASAIVAITLIASLMQIAKSICETRATKYCMATMEIIKEMQDAKSEQ